jgi:hypothetical protein
MSVPCSRQPTFTDAASPMMLNCSVVQNGAPAAMPSLPVTNIAPNPSPTPSCSLQYTPVSAADMGVIANSHMSSWLNIPSSIASVKLSSVTPTTHQLPDTAANLGPQGPRNWGWDVKYQVTDLKTNKPYASTSVPGLVNGVLTLGVVVSRDPQTYMPIVLTWRPI